MYDKADTNYWFTQKTVKTLVDFMIQVFLWNFLDFKDFFFNTEANISWKIRGGGDN